MCRGFALITGGILLAYLLSPSAAMPAQGIDKDACKTKRWSACYKLGETYMKSNELQLALHAFSAACPALPKACDAAAIISLKRKDQEQAMKSFDAGCRAGSGRSCSALGGILFADSSRPLHWDTSKAQRAGQLLARGCDLNDKHGCELLGEQLATVNPTKARAYREKACRLGDKKSCAALGR